MPRRDYALKTFVHRVLALRLVAAGVLLALAFGAFTYAREQGRIAEAVVLEARHGIEWIRADVRRLLDTGSRDLQSALQQALDAKSLPSDRHNGQFVYVRFYDARGAGLGGRAAPVDTDAATLQHAIDAAGQPVPGGDEPWQRSIEVAGHPHLYLVVPVPDRHGTPVAYAEGLFRISEAALAQARQAARRTALTAMLIVFATSLLLYPVILTLMRRLAEYSENLLAANLEILEVLGSAIAKRDSDTDAHNYRVTLYALRLAEAAGLGEPRMRALIKGAFLHDVGKIGVRDHILHKPGRLDADEFRVMQTHVDHGLDIVHRSRWLADAKDVVGSHHEKFDGSGYPRQTTGEAIPIEARIFAIADVFDALTSRRPYKEPLSFEETMKILNAGRDQHFDPALLDRFGAIARDLYDRYSGRDDMPLRDEVRAVVDRFFVGGLETLRF